LGVGLYTYTDLGLQVDTAAPSCKYG